MINVKYCKKCGRPYDYQRCPYCEWSKEEKKKEGYYGNKGSKRKISF